MKSDITLHQFRVFLKVAELGSVTRCANALAIPQPSVSRSLTRIETLLGVRLLARSRGGIELTTAGTAFHAHALEAVRQFNLAADAARQTREELAGEVRLAATESFAGIAFQPLVQRFQQRHPAARIRLMTSASAQIPSLIDNNIVDIGVIADTHSAPAMPIENLCSENLYLVGPHEHPLLMSASIRLEEVVTLPLFLNAMAGGFRARIDDACNRRGLNIMVQAEIDANEPLLDLVHEERGFTILPYCVVARKSRQHQFSATRIIDPTISRQLKLVTAATHQASATARVATALVHEIVDEFAETAQWRVIH